MDNLSSYERFSELLSTCQTQLFGYLYALTQNIHDADDLYQKTSMVLWQKFDQYREGTSFFQWARTAARYEALNFLRHRKQQRAMFSEAFQAELAAVWAEVEPEIWDARRQALSECVKKLPESDRQLVERCYGSDESLRNTAQQLGRPAKSVYDALRRIRRALIVLHRDHSSQGGNVMADRFRPSRVLDELTALSLSGQIDAPRAHQLEGILRSDGEALRWYRDMVSLQIDLRIMMSASHTNEQALARIEAEFKSDSLPSPLRRGVWR